MRKRNTIALILLMMVTAVSSASAQCNFSVTLTGKAVRCFGETNGEATVNIIPSGASSAPYVIQWFDGGAQSFRNDLPAGTHFVKVTDALGCFVTEFITIDQPQLLTTGTSPTHVRCHGQPQGSIRLTVNGGTTPYLYQWSNGESTQDLDDLVAGTYSVNVQDDKGCTTSATVTIEQPDALLVSPAVRGVSCFGGSDGVIRATVFGGVQPYRYQWSSQDTIPDIFDLPAGPHVLTVTDRNMCVLQETIVVPQPQPLGVSFDVKKVSCFDLPDGEIQAFVTGGTPDYRYKWSNSSFVLGDTTYHPKNLYRDDYTLEITDANGCQLIDSVRVEEPNPLVINLEATDATCFAKPDGAIDLSVTGGTVPYSYLWSNDSRTQDLSGLYAGQYRVLVADVLGCTRYGEIVVGQPDSLDFRVKIDEVTCKDETDGKISIKPVGGTPGYVVQWSNGSTDFSIDELPGDTYAVALTDANGCHYEGAFHVPINPEACITPIGIPNTFTPNNDGVNDLWVIHHHEEYPEMVVKVVNKWGKLVFSSTGYEVPWDGTQSGSPVQAGTYYYTITLNNGDPPFTGTLTIIR